MNIYAYIPSILHLRTFNLSNLFLHFNEHTYSQMCKIICFSYATINVKFVDKIIAKRQKNIHEKKETRNKCL